MDKKEKSNESGLEGGGGEGPSPRPDISHSLTTAAATDWLTKTRSESGIQKMTGFTANRGGEGGGGGAVGAIKRKDWIETEGGRWTDRTRRTTEKRGCRNQIEQGRRDQQAGKN